MGFPVFGVPGGGVCCSVIGCEVAVFSFENSNANNSQLQYIFSFPYLRAGFLMNRAERIGQEPDVHRRWGDERCRNRLSCSNQALSKREKKAPMA